VDEKELLKSISFDAVCRERFGESMGSTEVLKALQDEMQADIQKAMAINSIDGGGGFGDLGPLRLEDLDSTMSSVLYRHEHLVLQRWLPRHPAKQLIFQYNIQESYGNNRGRAGFIEGGGPGGSISRFSRHTAQIRFMGIQGGITHQATMLKEGGITLDPVAKENADRTLDLLANIERQLIWGDSTLTDVNGNVLEYDGLYKQLNDNCPDENIFDLRGAQFSLKVLDEIALIMHDARFTNDFSKFRMFAPGSVITDLSQQIRVDPLSGASLSRRMIPTGSVPSYDPGAVYDGYTTQFGKIPFTSSVFMQPCPGGVPVADTSEAFGTAVTIASVVAGSSTTSQMEAGTYYYTIAALYDSGESMPSAGVSVVVAEGQKATVNITPSSQRTELRGYRVYRATEADLSDAGWVADVPDDASSSVFVDLNDVIPNTSIALVLEGHEDNLMIAQLAPMMRFPLPPVKTTLPFYYLLYHTLLVKVPKRQFLIKNIGRPAAA
jgi:hypothetical protein